MRLFIAEKPSVAKAIAEELGITGKGEGYLACGKDKITWCFGHMLELAEPDEYTNDAIPRAKSGKKLWRIEDLPIIPEKWLIAPKKDAIKQLKSIERLLNDAAIVVNAGDSDREGQLLIDEILEYFDNKKPVLRFWVSAHDTISLKRGLQCMKNNDGFIGFGMAAKARSYADWLIGMNLSRAYTLSASRGGANTLLTVGRVQTPTLALVVNRDREIEEFKPIPYYLIKAAVQCKHQAFIASWKAGENQEGLDSEGRLVNLSIADMLVEKLSGKMGVVKEYKEEAKKKSHPVAFSLSDITLLASNKFGYSATDVLIACQALYETHKLTTYPRTDCAYLPESQHADAKAVLEAIKHVNPDLGPLIDAANPGIKSKTWDDAKVSVHYGIIPTMHKGCKEGLSEKERTIYDLIVRAYIAQFYPLHEYLSTTVVMDIAGERLETKGSIVTSNGWKTVYTEVNENGEAKEEENQTQTLPKMKIDDEINSLKASRQDAKTKAPSRFTEGTLQKAMENIHKFITEPTHKKMLREGDGIGTAATRASILSELQRRNFLEAKGKYIVSTTLGRSIIDALPEVVKSPVLTAIYERVLREIEKNEDAFNGFIERQVTFVREQVAKANEGAVRIKGSKESVAISKEHQCPLCTKGLCRRSGKKGFWWSCSGYPDCTNTYPDIKGRPNYNKKSKE